MSVSMKDLGIDRLSLDERASLAREILESVEAEQMGSLSTSQRVEMIRRQADPSEMEGAAPWDQVEAEILARIAPR